MIYAKIPIKCKYNNNMSMNNRKKNKVEKQQHSCLQVQLFGIESAVIIQTSNDCDKTCPKKQHNR